MKLGVYTLYDLKALIYNQPFFAVTHGAATRMVADIASDTQTTVGRHPSDYVLYCIGVYDDADGSITSFDPRHHVADVLSLLPPAKE